MSIFWGMYHGAGMRAVQSDVQAARRSATDARVQADELEARCERALLVCEALWTIMRDKLGVPEEELVNRVNEIDLSDGKLDGKVRRTAVQCGKCGKKVARRFQKCIYCATPIETDPFSS